MAFSPIFDGWSANRPKMGENWEGVFVDEEEGKKRKGRKTGLKCGFNSSRNKWTFGSRSLLYQEFRVKLALTTYITIPTFIYTTYTTAFPHCANARDVYVTDSDSTPCLCLCQPTSVYLHVAACIWLRIHDSLSICAYDAVLWSTFMPIYVLGPCPWWWWLLLLL